MTEADGLLLDPAFAREPGRITLVAKATLKTVPVELLKVMPKVLRNIFINLDRKDDGSSKSIRVNIPQERVANFE